MLYEVYIRICHITSNCIRTRIRILRIIYLMTTLCSGSSRIRIPSRSRHISFIFSLSMAVVFTFLLVLYVSCVVLVRV